ncbi:MAG: DNA repair exonuclease [Bacteroidota bacterium]
MKVLHFSDTHLGYSELDKVNKQGVNLREQDFYDAFRQLIDQAIEQEVDLIIHSGDFFHRPSPTNRALTFALEQLQRLTDRQIPLSVIAGNHETPKTIFTSPILKAFRSLPNIHPMFGQGYEQQTFGDLVVHGLPHINDPKVLADEMDRIAPVDGKFNILMLHTSIGKNYLMEEYGEQLYPPERLELLNQFDYVALGHWHNFQKVDLLQTAWYAGSTERMSETEIGKPKGYCLLEVRKGQPIEPTFHELTTRPWYKLVLKNCCEKSVEQIQGEITEQCQQWDLEGALLSIHFQRIESAQALQLNNRELKEQLPGPIHLNIKRQFEHKGDTEQLLSRKIESLDQLLRDFIHDSFDDDKKANSLTQKALHYFDLFESGEYRNR